MVIPIIIGALEIIPKGLVNGLQEISGDHPDYNIIKIGQNTEKSPGDLRTLAVTQTPVENHQLMLVRKSKRIMIYQKLERELFYSAF